MNNIQSYYRFELFLEKKKKIKEHQPIPIYKLEL